MNKKGFHLPIHTLRILILIALVIDVLALITIWLWLPLLDTYAFGWEYTYEQVARNNQALAFMYAFFIWCGIICAWWLIEGNGLLRSVSKQQSFTYQNAKRLKRVGIAFCLTALAFAAKLVMLPSLSTIFGLGMFLGLGLLFWVLSLLFHHAADIKSVYDLTI